MSILIFEALATEFRNGCPLADLVAPYHYCMEFNRDSRVLRGFRGRWHRLLSACAEHPGEVGWTSLQQEVARGLQVFERAFVILNRACGVRETTAAQNDQGHLEVAEEFVGEQGYYSSEPLTEEYVQYMRENLQQFQI